MDLNRICILAGGCLSLTLFLFHTQFHRLFSWRTGLAGLSLNNRRILMTVHLALLLLFLLIGIFSLLKAAILATDRQLAPWLNGGYALFWLWRAVWQHLYFVPPAGSKKTVLHYLLIAVSVLLAGVYAVPVFNV